MLKFWNYPQDASSSKPVGCIDLSATDQEQVYQADRSLCPRPRSIVIKLRDPVSMLDEKPNMYFLVSDSKPELRQWMKELNNTLKFIKDWNIS